MAKTNVIEFILTLGDGGAETLVKDYALLMDRDHFEVTVVVLHALEDSANLQRLKDHGIKILSLSSQKDVLKKLWRMVVKPDAVELTPDNVDQQTVSMASRRSGIKAKLRSLRNLFFGRKLLRMIRQTGATVVHAHLDVLEILDAVSGSLKGVRLFHTCHNVPSIVYVDGELPAAKRLIERNNLRLVALHADMATELNTMFDVNNTVIIRNGINMPKFENPGIDKQVKRKQLEIPDDAFVIGHIGRFSEQKNHMFLVDIFYKTIQQKENAYLLMVGAGDSNPVEEKLRAYSLNGKYQVLSQRKDINELLAVMDVFVFPSLFEGLSVSLIEAQASGLRCIISDCCSEEGICTETCIPLPLGDPAIWAEAVLNVDMKRECTNDLHEYDMNREIRRLEKLYLGQLDKSK